ncbi:hypothetical protein SASPL_120879 [Salvia splendens]|uniref:ABC transporter domain-containing protein n=1 Tax=Salvia splendens TaxID=180675 RepID=A0A8X8XRD6_SALSN|nr:hypothetical protein SASPL_120879 [Salvia splendens]
MAAAVAREELTRSMSRKASFASSSTKGWASASFREAFGAQGGDVFQKSGRQDDEEQLKWAAIERLPTYDRMRKGILKQVVIHEEIDFGNLGVHNKKHIKDTMLKALEDDNERFLLRLRDRINRVGINVPKCEVRFEHLSVEGDAFAGSRALPTLYNSTINAVEGILDFLRLFPSKKKTIRILTDVSGIVRPARLTLLLGPPSSGKTTLLKAPAGKLEQDLRESGKVTYCGHELREFIPQRTSRYELLAELSRREKDAGIKPDPEIDAFMKAIAVSGQRTSLVTHSVLKVLGIDICADTMVGDEMRRGISGGQKKRVTTGEMLVGPTKVFLMDEISTGLDSSTTYQIIKYMKQMVHIMDITMIISLLQPAPETDTKGKIVYQGPREHVLGFFESVGFKCPERKGVTDFLHEVTSKKDQEQYWSRKNVPCEYVSDSDFAFRFQSFHVGQKIFGELGVPYDKSRVHPAALVKEKYGISNKDLLKACLSREWLLMKRNSFVYTFKTTQITIMALFTFTVFFRTQMKHGHIDDGGNFHGALFFSLVNVMFNGMAELAMTIFRLPVFFKQRDALFYPAWAFALPIWLLRLPISVMESGIWIILTYYTVGYAPSASRFFMQFLAFVGIHQMALGLFRFIAALGRTQAIHLYTATCVISFAADDLQPWMRWAYYLSPMSYGQNAIVIVEFLDPRWSGKNDDGRFAGRTVGEELLAGRGMFTEQHWYWICVIALFGFSLFFNLCFVAALTYLKPLGDSKSGGSILEDETTKSRISANGQTNEVRNAQEQDTKRGVVLPFKPLSLSFDNVNYYVDMPTVRDTSAATEGVSGAFRPGVLTGLIGVSGAGKTTLMDVLAGRKTGGYIEGDIRVSGFPKNQETFARVSGYCEQNDIHSPHVTVYESLLYSAWLRLPADMFVEEVMDLVELNSLRNSLVGLPGVDGLSTEQRKRLTIAVELVANPSIIFMDEPTSGLDARAAAIVMRASISGVPQIRQDYNPATWMVEASSAAVEFQLDMDFAEIYSNSDLNRKNLELIQKLSNPEAGSHDLFFPTKYSQPLLVQFVACFWKQYWSYWRNPQYNAIRFFMTTVIGLIFGVIFWNKGTTMYKEQDLTNLLGAMYAAVLFLGGTNTSAVQSVVAIERTVFYHERAAGMFSALPYAFAQVSVETSYIAVQTFLCSLLLYSMIGFEWGATKFIWFYYYVFMCFVYFTLYGMMLVALTPSYQIAAILMSFFLSFWNLFSGFLIPRMLIPVWWRWYYWGSPVAWTIYGLVTSQLGDKTEQVLVPDHGDMPIKDYLKVVLGYDSDFLGYVALAHVGWALLFFVVFVYGIKVLNFQRR